MDLLTPEAALERILEVAAPLATETVSTGDALGRATAEHVYARRTLPPTDVSAMDGYAVLTSDLAAVPIEIEVVETIFAGQVPTRALAPGQAARIMTGAAVPQGADAVVMQEKTSRLSDDLVEVQVAVAPGANIRLKGEDITEGALLFRAGTAIGLAEAGALWAQGVQRLAVHRRPTVAIASSGDELCNAWEEPRGRIVDTNSPVLAEAVKRAGGVPTLLGLAPDRLDAVTQQLAKGLHHDVLIAVAGASVGEKDFTRQAFEALGVSVEFWKVALKPGKPMAFGVKDGTLIFALPGNPVSAMVTFHLFVRQALRVMQGLPGDLERLPARAAEPMTPSRDVRHFLRCTTRVEEGALWAVPLSSQSSGALASATLATHLVELPTGGAPISRGDPVSVIPLGWR